MSHLTAIDPFSPQDWRSHPVKAAKRFLRQLLGTEIIIGIEPETLAALQRIAERHLEVLEQDAVTQRIEAIRRLAQTVDTLAQNPEAPNPHVVFNEIHRLLTAFGMDVRDHAHLHAIAAIDDACAARSNEPSSSPPPHPPRSQAT